MPVRRISLAYWNGSARDTLLVHDENVFVCSYTNAEIYQYDQYGILLGEFTQHAGNIFIRKCWYLAGYLMAEKCLLYIKFRHIVNLPKNIITLNLYHFFIRKIELYLNVDKKAKA